MQAQTSSPPLFTFAALVLLDDGGGVEGVLLSELGLDLLNEGPQVREVLLQKKICVSARRQVVMLKGGGCRYLLGLGPVRLGEELVLVGALRGTADAEDAVVGLLGGQALEGELHGLALLLEEIVVPMRRRGSANCVPKDHHPIFDAHVQFSVAPRCSPGRASRPNC